MAGSAVPRLAGSHRLADHASRRLYSSLVLAAIPRTYPRLPPDTGPVARTRRRKCLMIDCAVADQPREANGVAARPDLEVAEASVLLVTDSGFLGDSFDEAMQRELLDALAAHGLRCEV